jgi:hypothetical protein
MALNAPVGGGTKRELIDAGSYNARCVHIVYMGSVLEETGIKQGQLVPKLRLVFELVDEKRVFSADKGEQPLFKDKEYTFSMSEKSNLRKDITAWRGKALTDEEAAKFDIDKLLGQACLVGISHKTSGKGSEYDYISSITKPMKGAMIAELTNESVYLSYEDWDEDMFQSLPSFVREKMEKTPEYLAMREQDAKIEAELDKVAKSTSKSEPTPSAEFNALSSSLTDEDEEEPAF